MAKYNNAFDMAKAFYNKHIELLHECKGSEKFWDNVFKDVKYFKTPIQKEFALAIIDEFQRICKERYSK